MKNMSLIHEDFIYCDTDSMIIKVKNKKTLMQKAFEGLIGALQTLGELNDKDSSLTCDKCGRSFNLFIYTLKIAGKKNGESFYIRCRNKKCKYTNRRTIKR